MPPTTKAKPKKKPEPTLLTDKLSLPEQAEIINDLPFNMESAQENKSERKVQEVNKQEEAILPSYEPSLDLRDYNYPTLDLFSDSIYRKAKRISAIIFITRIYKREGTGWKRF